MPNIMVAYLPAQSSMEMSFTSAEFSADLFALANDKTFDWKLTTIPNTKKLTFNAPSTGATSGIFTATFDATNHDGEKVTDIPEHKYEDGTADDCAPTKYPQTGQALDDMILKSVRVEGFVKEEGKTPAVDTLYFSVTSGAKEGSDGTLDTYTVSIGLSTEDYNAIHNADGNIEIEVYWEDYVWTKAVRIDNKRSAIGELVAKYPVYSAGDEQQAGGIKGYVLVRIFRCRATTMPGFDSSYKSAVSNQVTFSTLESNQADGATYTIAFYDESMGAKTKELHTA